MMRRFVVVITLAAILAVACPAEQEVLTNDSGMTAIGLIVRFTRSVQIQSYDSELLAWSTCDGFSDVFVFTDGSVRRGGRFAISWFPGTADVASVHWYSQSSAYTQEGPYHTLLHPVSTEIGQDMVAQLLDESAKAEEVSIVIAASAKGRSGDEAPILRLRANGETIWEVGIDAWPDFEEYETETVISSGPVVFSIGSANPYGSTNLSVLYVDIDGTRYELVSLDDYALFGLPPELDPTFVTFWDPGELAWLAEIKSSTE